MGTLCSRCFKPANIQDGEDGAGTSANNENGKILEPKAPETDPRLPLSARQKFQISKR